MDEELERAKILANIASDEAAEVSDSSEMSMLQSFGNPREYRTMSNIHPNLVQRLSIIEARGQRNHSRMRQRFVENVFLMNRSGGGWGSEQMVKVATARQAHIHMPEKKGFFSGLFGPKPPAQ